MMFVDLLERRWYKPALLYKIELELVTKITYCLAKFLDRILVDNFDDLSA